MIVGYWKNKISLFIVLTFLLLRVVDAHAFSHFSDDSDQIHCELCEVILTSKHLTPLINDNFQGVEQKNVTNFQRHFISFCYETSQYCITLPESIHNKPPPQKE
ncbi:hypothetical protein [Aquimarina algicola]|uniref:Uncharacterized protein n=1 Tax=Aquimarina algicola TaxID=2589995 RepID=A0A504J5G1_9FLAO|nr:hypothetical protein [Aquimarina algicola]TPN82843.1 hypothetical protein FHK87_20670 [Aquimarina algicola]